MTFLRILLGMTYVARWIFLRPATLRKGHPWPFSIGFLLSDSADHRRADRRHRTRCRTSGRDGLAASLKGNRFCGSERP
jgi:hypothetical protein